MGTKTAVAILAIVLLVLAYLSRKAQQLKQKAEELGSTVDAASTPIAKTLPDGVVKVEFPHAVTGLYLLSPEEQILGRPFTIEELEARRSAMGNNEIELPNGLTLMIQGGVQKQQPLAL